jgi:hypothetical protein
VDRDAPRRTAVRAASRNTATVAFAPPLLGFPSSVSAAGTIALVAGVFQMAAMLLAPRYGALRRLPMGSM